MAVGVHFYTTNAAERDGAGGAGYGYEWAECYVFPNPAPRSKPAPGTPPIPGTVPLFRLYKGGTSGGFFSSVVDFVTDAVDTFVDVVKVVTDPVEKVVEVVLSPIAWVAEAFQTLPVIGRFIGWIVAIVQASVNFAWSLPDFALALLGILPEKRLRLCLIVQRDEQGQPVSPLPLAAGGSLPTAALTPAQAVQPAIQFAFNVFLDQAKVRIVPVGDDFVHVPDGNSSADTLDVCSEWCSAGHDLTGAGASIAKLINNSCFLTTTRRVLGYGNPVCAIAVRSFTDGKVGTSLGPLTDYVLINFNRPLTSDPDSSTLAHEIGHACNLWHFSDSGNLMNGSATPTDPLQRRSLTRLQIAWLRSSRHVTT